MDGMARWGVQLRQCDLLRGCQAGQVPQQGLRARHGQQVLPCCRAALPFTRSIEQQLAGRQRGVVVRTWGAGGGGALEGILHQCLQHSRLPQRLQPQLPLPLLLLAATAARRIRRVGDVQQQGGQEGGPLRWQRR